MRIPTPDGSSHLTYCLNTHPGESLESCMHAIEEHVVAVRRSLGLTEPFGVGLRIADQASRQLETRGRLDAFRAMLERNELYAFTINGFPYRAFHGRPVKANVYAPDWRQPERLAYTERLARILAELLPEGVEGSISTVPGSYKAWTRTADCAAIARALGRCALTLHRLEAETGRRICVAIEPEPDCLFETIEETVAFFAHSLPREGGAAMRAQGFGGGSAEEILQRHIGVCLDTCHAAVEFESIEDAVARFAEADIRLAKVQISAALRCPDVPAARERLRAFDEPTYLHQVKIRDAAGRIAGYRDLAPALAEARPDSGAEWRVHFHVPLHFEGDDVLGTTGDNLTPAFFQAAAAAGCRHYEIETYTFHVLPEALRAAAIEDSIAREFEWVLPRLADLP